MWEWLTSGHDILGDIPSLGLRTLLGFTALLAVMRLTGKRTVTQLAPFDFAVIILIGELVAIPIADPDLDIFHGLIPVMLIGMLHGLLSTLNLHYRPLEDLTEGKATKLIEDGKMIKQNLLKERVSRRDLWAALRLKDVKELNHVKEARLEHSGGISVIMTEQAEPLTRGDGLPPRMREELDAMIAAHMERLRIDLLAQLQQPTKETADAGDASLH